MPTSTESSPTNPTLIRGMGLGSATALNMIDMIGVGPFITMPLVLGAMGGPQAMLGWIVGALLAVCDGLWSAEVGAADFISVYLAAFLQRSALDCQRMHRAGRIRCVLLAEPRNGLCRAHFGRDDPVGGAVAGELDCDARHRARSRDLRVHGVAAVPADHGDRAALENIVARRDGNDRMDHLRRAYAFQCSSRV